MRKTLTLVAVRSSLLTLVAVLATRCEVPFGEDVSEGAAAFNKEALRKYMVQHQPGAQSSERQVGVDMRQVGH